MPSMARIANRFSWDLWVIANDPSAPATTPAANIPSKDQPPEEFSGKVAICLSDASFHFLGHDRMSITSLPVWCHQER